METADHEISEALRQAVIGSRLSSASPVEPRPFLLIETTYLSDRRQRFAQAATCDIEQARRTNGRWMPNCGCHSRPVGAVRRSVARPVAQKGLNGARRDLDGGHRVATHDGPARRELSAGRDNLPGWRQLFRVLEARRQVHLVFFDRVDAGKPTRVVDLEPQIQRSYLTGTHLCPSIAAGQLYGYRVDGPWEPERGRRFDRDKVLLDPYGRCVARSAGWSRAAARKPGDNCASALKSVIVAHPAAYDWEGDQLPRTPFSRTVVYEMHLGALHGTPTPALQPRSVARIEASSRRFLTCKTWASPPSSSCRCSPSMIKMLREVSTTGGISPSRFSLPILRYSSSPDPLGALDEFRDMVKALHRAGIEVILDVVYNHTTEGGTDGPTMCFRGFGCDTYYILNDDGSLSRTTADAATR